MLKRKMQAYSYMHFSIQILYMHKYITDFSLHHINITNSLLPCNLEVSYYDNTISSVGVDTACIQLTQLGASLNGTSASVLLILTQLWPH